VCGSLCLRVAFGDSLFSQMKGSYGRSRALGVEVSLTCIWLRQIIEAAIFMAR